MNTFLTWTSALACALVIAACGGGSDAATTPPTTSGPPPVTVPAAEGSISGVAVSADAGMPLAAVRIAVAGQTVMTAADGSFTLAAVPPGERVVVRATASGYTEAFAAVDVSAQKPAAVRLRLFAAAPAQTIDSSVASTVSAPGSTAQVRLPAAGLVDAASGAAVVGPVRVSVTPVDPSRDPAQMPGNYTALAAGAVRSIESFGAVKVDLRDADGRRLNLAPGQTATVRIALATRSLSPPPTVPLFYFDESSARWVEEGTAMLAGSGTQRYYEGQVRHFTYWNADQVTETSTIGGCLVDQQRQPVADVRVMSEGVDYSGSSDAFTNAQGRFNVAARKGSRVAVYAESGARQSNAVIVDSGAQDRALEPCLVIDRTPGPDPLVPPLIVVPPQPQTVATQVPFAFTAVVIGSQPMSFSWTCNEVPIAGANGPVWGLASASLGDDGCMVRIEARNAAGSARSAPVRLTVTGQALPPLVTQPPADITVNAGQTVTFAVTAISQGGGALRYQWKRNGVAIAGATAAAYTTAATVLADDTSTFSVVVTNDNGAVTSAAATLHVVLAGASPTIARQPGNQVVDDGATATFSVRAGGAGALRYQWLRDGAPIAGATAASYSLTATAADDGARFSVVVGSATGSTTSEVGLLVIPGGDEAARTRLLLMAQLWQIVHEAGALAFLEADPAFKVVAPLCDSGTATLKLDGGTPAAGQQLPAGSHQLVADFADCQLVAGQTATGNSTVSYRYTDLDRLQGSYVGVATKLRVRNLLIAPDAPDAEVWGSVEVVVDGVRNANVDSFDITYTPAVGTTWINVANGVVARFEGGRVVTHTVTRDPQSQQPTLTEFRVRMDGLRIRIGGVLHVFEGALQIYVDGGATITGTGAIAISADGAPIGRILASDQIYTADVRGPVVVLAKQRAAGKPARRAAMLVAPRR